jgi:hypothetical protein
MKWRWNRTMLNLCGIVAAILTMATGRKNFNIGNQFGTSLSTHISNLHKIWAVKIQHCPISSKFDMWGIDSWHWKISTDRHFQNGHHNSAKIQHCPISSKFDMWVDNDVQNWFPTTMLNLCGIVAAILKMATVRNFSMSGINSGHH